MNLKNDMLEVLIGGGGKTNPNLRKFLLLTLSHTEKEERQLVTPTVIIKRIREAIPQCRSIVVANELHAADKQEEKGRHFHVGILNSGVSRFTITKTLIKQFPEFTGSQFFVTFHRSWGTICQYVTKNDKEPIVWGEISLQGILNIARNVNDHKIRKTTSHNMASEKQIKQLKTLGTMEQWNDIYKHPDLAITLFRSYNNIKQIFNDLLLLRECQLSFDERILKYLEEHNNPKEYDIEELLEKYVLLDWIAVQLLCERPIKTKQLFIIGEPNKQKTLLIEMLSHVLLIYFASSKLGDFSGAHNNYDLWVFDEFSTDTGRHFFSEENDKEFLKSNAYNILLKVLDGQKCRLDSKYSNIFLKNKNVPIICIANALPYAWESAPAFRERFLAIRFKNVIEDLQEERIIATFWGCILRRRKQFKEFCPGLPSGKLPKIFYNDINFLIENVKQQKPDCNTQEFSIKHNDFLASLKRQQFLFYKRREEGDKKIEEYKFPCFLLLIDFKESSTQSHRDSLNLFQIACIPLKKRDRNELGAFVRHEDLLNVDSQVREDRRETFRNNGKWAYYSFLEPGFRETHNTDCLDCSFEVFESFNTYLHDLFSPRGDRCLALFHIFRRDDRDYATWPIYMEQIPGLQYHKVQHIIMICIPDLLKDSGKSFSIGDSSQQEPIENTCESQKQCSYWTNVKLGKYQYV